MGLITVVFADFTAGTIEFVLVASRSLARQS